MIIPSHFLLIALIYSDFASIVIHLTGRRLIPLRIAQQKAEANGGFKNPSSFEPCSVIPFLLR
jgi:ABC-type uncharacterized transport system fused permease/ATPase subunit